VQLVLHKKAGVETPAQTFFKFQSVHYENGYKNSKTIVKKKLKLVEVAGSLLLRE
jgi:hypothetical protein